MSNLCVLACSLRFGVREGSRRLVLPPEGRGLRAQGPASLGRALELLHVESFTSQTVTPYTETVGFPAFSDYCSASLGTGSPTHPRASEPGPRVQDPPAHPTPLLPEDDSPVEVSGTGQCVRDSTPHA